MNLKTRIQQGESEVLEFKESLGTWKETLRTLSAFANTRGGTVLLGIADIGEVIGVQIGKRTIEDLANKVKENSDPKLFPGIEVKSLNGKEIITIKVEESRSKPVFAFDRAYKRVGRATVRATSEEIRKMALEGKKIYWDELICEEAGLKDLDEKKVRWFLTEARRQRGLKIPEDTLPDDALMRLKLLREGKLTNAALLLFGREPAFIQSEMKCIRFDGNKPVKPYIDFQTIEGNVFDLVDQAADFMLRNIKKAIWLVPGQIQREEKHEYPSDAIREAIVNAVVHRDYSSPSKVQLRVFDDSIEVWNPGKLPDGWTIERLKQKHESIPPNPLLFKQFFWVRYVEDVGGGTLDMIHACENWGLPAPDFEDTGTAIVVTFRKSALTPEILAKLKLNERQLKAVDFVKQNGKIATKEYCSSLKVARDTANRDLKGLLEKGVLKKRGSGPRIYYVLTDASIGQYRTVSDSKFRTETGTFQGFPDHLSGGQAVG